MLHQGVGLKHTHTYKDPCTHMDTQALIKRCPQTGIPRLFTRGVGLVQGTAYIACAGPPEEGFYNPHLILPGSHPPTTTSIALTSRTKTMCYVMTHTVLWCALQDIKMKFTPIHSFFVKSDFSSLCVS